MSIPARILALSLAASGLATAPYARAGDSLPPSHAHAHSQPTPCALSAVANTLEEIGKSAHPEVVVPTPALAVQQVQHVFGNQHTPLQVVPESRIKMIGRMAVIAAEKGMDPFSFKGQQILSHDTLPLFDLDHRVSVVVPAGRKQIIFAAHSKTNGDSHLNLSLQHDVDAAGEIALTLKPNGRYTAVITNQSGGYHPPASTIHHLVNLLLETGIPIDDIKIHTVTGIVTSKEPVFELHLQPANHP